MAYRSGSSMTRLTSEDGDPIAPSDVTKLPYTTVEVHLGGGGDLAVRYKDQSAVKVLPALTPGRHSLAVDYIMATNTTATNISVSY